MKIELGIPIWIKVRGVCGIDDRFFYVYYRYPLRIFLKIFQNMSPKSKSNTTLRIKTLKYFPEFFQIFTAQNPKLCLKPRNLVPQFKKVCRRGASNNWSLLKRSTFSGFNMSTWTTAPSGWTYTIVTNCNYCYIKNNYSLHGVPFSIDKTLSRIVLYAHKL